MIAEAYMGHYLVCTTCLLKRIERYLKYQKGHPLISYPLVSEKDFIAPKIKIQTLF